MQTERSKKSLYLFEVELDEDELEALVRLEPGLLSSLIFRCGRIMNKKREDREAISIFLNNYQMIMKLHSSIIASTFSVNMCLHFALLYSEHLLLENCENQAKVLLKQTQNYAEIVGVDAMLIGVCLNNLSFLYSRQGKVYKSLSAGLKAVGIISDHLQWLKGQKDRKRLTEDVIVFVNVLMLTQGVLRKILQNNDKTFFKSLFKIVNCLGYSFSQKYLGEQSWFTKKFYVPEDSVLLPVYREEEQEEEKDKLGQFQIKIAQQLEGIYTQLKDLNLGPEVYYIREHSLPSKKSEESSIIQLDCPQVPEPEYSVSYTENFEIQDWQTEVSIFRQATDLLAARSCCSFLGHIQFKFSKERQQIIQKISEDKLIKILTCLNFLDVLPCEFDLKSMSAGDFLKRVFLNFVTIEKKQLKIVPRSQPVIPPWKMKFCGQSSFIFVNHICFRKFRMAVCPCEGNDTIYLQLDFKSKSIYSIIDLIELECEGISRLYHQYYSQSEIEKSSVKFGKVKKLVIKDSERFRSKILKILQQFQFFLTDDDADYFQDILNSTSSGDQNYKYYLFSESSQEKGQFYQFHYRSNANYIEIYLKNNFKTYKPQGMAEAKGNFAISPQSFLKEFGVALRPAKKWLPAFYSILAQKFSLKVFEQPIEEMEEDRFEENAITQLPLSSKFFMRKFIEFEGYMLPLTIEVVSIHTEKPVGIRVSVYEPIKCINTGLFIYVNADYWQKPPEQQTESNPVQLQIDSIDLRKVKYFHNFHKGYFLTRWLKQQGFSHIFNRLAIVNRSLQVRGVPGKFIRIQQFL